MIEMLSRGVSGISYDLDKERGRPPNRARIHAVDGYTVQINAIVHDLPDRTELGYITLRDDDVRERLEDYIRLPESFSQPLLPQKLGVEDTGSTVIAGLSLRDKLGEEILVVAGGLAYTLAVYAPGAEGYNLFDPRFPLEDYKRSPLA